MHAQRGYGEHIRNSHASANAVTGTNVDCAELDDVLKLDELWSFVLKKANHR